MDSGGRRLGEGGRRRRGVSGWMGRAKISSFITIKKNFFLVEKSNGLCSSIERQLMEAKERNYLMVGNAR